MPPPVADTMEVWECAAVLGIDTPEQPASSRHHGGRASPRRDGPDLSAGRRMLHERMRAHREGREQPTWDDVAPGPRFDPTIAAEMQRLAR